MTCRTWSTFTSICGGIGRNDQHVGMRLDEDARFALVGIAQVLARLDGLGKALLQRVGLGDANAVGAMAAEIGQAVGDGPLQTVHRLRNHLSQRELARALRAGEDHRVRKVLVRQHLAQRVHHLGVAVKIRKGHSRRKAEYLVR